MKRCKGKILESTGHTTFKTKKKFRKHLESNQRKKTHYIWRSRDQKYSSLFFKHYANEKRETEILKNGCKKKKLPT